MKHRVGFNRLSRKASHRKAMLRNMVTSLFNYEKITTTKAKALEIRRIAEKMITRAKVDSVHNRRMAARYIWDKGIVNKLFTEIGPKNANRDGGYCRILKIGSRNGDAAEMVVISLVESDNEAEGKTEKPAKKKKEKAPKAESKKTETEKVTAAADSGVTEVGKADKTE
ncbi:50S ribosomal protein L17 [Marispirochaeta sp.]|jgi:large subunit ribosomal protein L17|uniref:50S ribosomal protein L17 n=1 Tax=Marispirochaeta sp. TaxID=2038653 RepID=UPI0029C69A32|nr:50S ribosomal protein L17 [Marispirochaeta sp.]